MNTKLTLRIDESLINKGKAYARKNGKSLSKLISEYLTALEKNSDISPQKTAREPFGRDASLLFHAYI